MKYQKVTKFREKETIFLCIISYFIYFAFIVLTVTYSAEKKFEMLWFPISFQIYASLFLIYK